MTLAALRSQLDPVPDYLCARRGQGYAIALTRCPSSTCISRSNWADTSQKHLSSPCCLTNSRHYTHKPSLRDTATLSWIEKHAVNYRRKCGLVSNASRTSWSRKEAPSALEGVRSKMPRRSRSNGADTDADVSTSEAQEYRPGQDMVRLKLPTIHCQKLTQHYRRSTPPTTLTPTHSPTQPLVASPGTLCWTAAGDVLKTTKCRKP